MDMSEYSGVKHGNRFKELTEAIRRNKDILAHVFMFLSTDPPNASAAQESFEEIRDADKIAIFGVSTTKGGIWETWERDALKFGRLDATNSYAVWQRRPSSYEIE